MGKERSGKTYVLDVLKRQIANSPHEFEESTKILFSWAGHPPWLQSCTVAHGLTNFQKAQGEQLAGLYDLIKFYVN